MKSANKALYYTVALVAIIFSSLGSIVFVSSRASDNQEVVIGGVLAFLGATVPSLLALMAALNVDHKAVHINKKVNGTITSLAERNVELSREVTAAQSATTTAQTATDVAHARAAEEQKQE